MNEFHELCTSEDANALKRLCKGFKFMVITAIDYTSAPGVADGGFDEPFKGELTLRMALPHIVPTPTIEFVFKDIHSWKPGYLYRYGFTFENAYNHRFITLWNSFCPKKRDFKESTWILAKRVEWRFTENPPAAV